MKRATMIVSLFFLWTESAASTPFEACQREATRTHIWGMATTDLMKVKEAIEKQSECRKLATEADAAVIKFQDEVNQLHKKMVSEGHNIAF